MATTIASLAVKVGADISEMQTKLNQASNQVKGFGNRVGGALSTARQAVTPVALGIAAIGGASLNAAIQFEDNFANVIKTVNASDTELAALKESIRTMATDTDLSALEDAHTELTNIAAIGGQLGVETGDLETFTQVVGAMTVATDLSAESAAQFAARFANVTGMDIGNIEDLSDTLVTLGNNSAASESEISEVASRLASLAGLGFDVDEILGYSAAVKSLGLNSELGSTNLTKTITDMTSAAAAGGPELEAWANATGMTADEFSNLQTNDPSATLDSFLQRLGQMDATTAITTLQDLGITSSEQQRTLLTLAQGFETVESSVDMASDAYKGNNATMDELGAKAETTKGKINTFKNNVNDLAITLGDKLLPAANSVVTGFTDLVQGLADGDVEQALGGIGGAVQPIVDAISDLTGSESFDVGGGLIAWIDAFQNFKQIVTVILDDIQRRFTIMKLDIELGASELYLSVQRALPSQIQDQEGMFNAQSNIANLGSRRNNIETADRINDALREGLNAGEPLQLGDLVDLGEGLEIPLESLLPAITDESASALLRNNLADTFQAALAGGDSETAGGLLPLADMMSFDPEDMRAAIVSASAAAFGEDGEMLDVVIDTAAAFDVDPNTEQFQADVTAAIEAQNYPVTVDAPVSVNAIMKGVQGEIESAFGGSIENYHSGGTFRSAAGEGLAILRDGERVLTPGEAAGHRSGGGGVIINYSPLGESGYDSLMKLNRAASDAGY